MQGYTWNSNQRPPRIDQERPPPHYQERPPPHYQERPPPHYQERPPPHYQERPPLHYQEQSQLEYQDARNDQSNMFQAQYNTQLYTTSQTRYSNGQQHAANQSTSKNYFVSALQPNSHGYYAQTNRAHPQYPYATSNTQQHYPSENTNTNGYYAQFGTQSNASSPQNYRNTGHNQAQMYQSPQSDHDSSKGNNRSWRFHNYNHGSPCSMNNQQQLQPPITAPRHHQKQQQPFSRQHSGKQYNMNHRSQGHHPRSTSWAQNKRVSNNPSQAATNYTSCNSTTPPSGTQSNISLPSNNLNQSPVNQNQPELRSTADPDLSATQSQNNQSTEQPSQGTNSGTHNVKETSQMTGTDEAHARFFNSLIYKLLCSKKSEQDNKQQSAERVVHNTCSGQSEVCATNRTGHFSEPTAQCTVEPPSKTMKYAGDQRNYWNKESIFSKERSDFGVQSVRPGNHQIGSKENRPTGMSQQNILYSTDPADCLEAVFALQKVSQHIHKAIAIVPPISQQTSNTAEIADSIPQKADNPSLKIDSVWSVVEESDVQKTADDKLSKSPSPTAQQEDKSIEIKTTSNIADSDTCSTNPVECQKNVQQADCDSNDASFDLSSVPVVKYTLEKLMDLVKSLEMKELSSGCPERSESFFNTILKLFWNGNQAYLVETLKSFRKEMEQYFFVEIIRDYESVVFESIETEDLKKLAYCDVLNTEMYSSSEEFRSSWLNVDGQPADIEKVLSEPLLDNLTVINVTPQLFSDNTVVSLGVNSPKHVPESSADEKSVKLDTCSPTALFTPQSGSNNEEIAIENNRHSFAGLSRNAFQSSVSREKETFLSSVSCEKQTCKKQEDFQQNHSFNTKSNSPLPKRSTEKPVDCSNEIKVFRQDHYERTRHNVSVSDSLPLSPGDNVSDGVKNSEVSFFNETLYNSKDTWQKEDISNDENPGNVEALNNSSDIRLVEDISDDENSGSKEIPPISSDLWPVEDITDDENTGNEVPPISSDIWHVEDISDDENQTNKDTCCNSSDICVVEDVSNNENSSDGSLLMKITVLSSEDANTFFQQLEDEPECSIKTITSKFDCPGLEACFVPGQPSHEYNKADTCSLCGTKIALSNSTNVTDYDGDLFCLRCWEQAPLLELEEEPYSSMTNEADALGSPAKSNIQGQDCSLPCLKLEVMEPNVASAKECIVDIMLTGQRSDQMVTSEQGQNSSSIELKVKELKVASPETCIVAEGLTGQKSLAKSQLGQNCSSPSLELKIFDPTVASTEDCTEDERLMGQKSTSLLKSELTQHCGPPSLELQVKMPNLSSPEKWTENKISKGQKRDSNVKSDSGPISKRPSFELEISETTVASPEDFTEDERLMEQKSESLFKSEPRQNCEPPSHELQVKMPNLSSPEKWNENKRPKGQKRDSNVKSESGPISKQPSFELEVSETTVASTEDRTEDERLMEQKSESLFKSELRKICSSASFELQVEMPNNTSPEECVADQGLTGQKSDSIVISVTQKVHDIQWPANQEIQPNDKTSHPQCNKPPPQKSACFKHKLKSGSVRTVSDDFVLFTPDVVVKKNLNLPGVIAKKRPSGESQESSKVKKFKEHRQETSPHHRENLQNVTKKVPGHSNGTPPHRSKKKRELHGILSVNKTKTTESKKVRFDLYGSSGEKQIYAHGRRFSAPATLTVSDTCTEFTNELSAKQKVLNQWSSTFIPKTKSFSPRSPQKAAPKKKKTQKTQDLLKSNMSALKSHLTHREKLLSSSERETNHFRKPFFLQKLKKNTKQLN